MDNLYSRAAELILNARKTVAFTGAGISTESGIPDFRSPGGIWSRFDPRKFTFQKFVADIEVRRQAWRMLRTSGLLSDVQPNPAHCALVDMEKLGRLDCVITQNVDGLHQKAGNPESSVIELHGTLRQAICLSCRASYPMREILKRLNDGVEVPTCDRCRGIVKSATVSFGQSLSPDVVAAAERRSKACDLFLVVGSSLAVYPAALMPRHALKAGAKLIIINLTPTPLDDKAEVVIREKAGEALPGIVERVRDRLSTSP